jgi:CubicO group peptidase (beta-lactamase class C family)
MKGMIVALLVVSLVAGCDRSSAPTIDAIVAPHLAPNQGGIAIAVIRDGELIVEQGFGPADFDRRTPVTPATVFDLASLTKQFTGMAILVLAERGALSLDDDVRKYLPELPVFDAARPIRISDLSQHVSGLPETRGAATPTEADVLAWLAALPQLEVPTGGRWEYRNLNYLLLGRIVERVSGTSFREFVAREVFGPANMRSAQVLDVAGGEIAGRATGFCNGNACRDDGYGLPGAGGVFASLEDLIAWDRALAEGTALPTAALMRALEESLGYALGWRFGARGGQRLMEHDGDSIGTRTYLVRYLDEPLTIIILSNQTRLDVEKLEAALAAYALGEKD